MTVRGDRYRVIQDDSYTFDIGDVVVAIDDDDEVPYCVLECDYDEWASISEYSQESYTPLVIGEDILQW